MVKKRGLERINNVRGDQFPFCTPRHAQLVWSKGVFPNFISPNSLPLEPFVFSLFFFFFFLNFSFLHIPLQEGRIIRSESRKKKIHPHLRRNPSKHMTKLYETQENTICI